MPASGHGKNYAKQQRYDDAIRCLKRSFRLGRYYQKYEDLGDYIVKAGQTKSAFRAYRSAYADSERRRNAGWEGLHVVSAREQMKLGSLYFHNGEHSNAIIAFEVSLSLNPSADTLEAIRSMARAGSSQPEVCNQYKVFLNRKVFRDVNDSKVAPDR